MKLTPGKVVFVEVVQHYTRTPKTFGQRIRVGQEKTLAGVLLRAHKLKGQCLWRCLVVPFDAEVRYAPFIKNDQQSALLGRALSETEVLDVFQNKVIVFDDFMKCRLCDKNYLRKKKMVANRLYFKTPRIKSLLPFQKAFKHPKEVVDCTVNSSVCTD